MTRPEADDLFREYARSRDHAVMARLVEENLPLSQAVARKFQGRGVEKDDLEQVAAMALMQAIERFDPERGLQFSTFALPTIAGSVRNYLRDRGGTIRLTRSLREQLTKLRRVSDELTRKLQREPSMRELAEAMEMPPEELLTLLLLSAKVFRLSASPALLPTTERLVLATETSAKCCLRKRPSASHSSQATSRSPQPRAPSRSPRWQTRFVKSRCVLS